MRHILALLLCSISLADAQAAPKGVLTIRFLDVGQGDAVLITAPEGQSLLYDGGRSESRMRELIRHYDIQNVSLVAASHGDSDHITGLIPVVALNKPKYFLNNGLAATTQVWQRLTNVVSQAGTQGLLAKGQTINLGSVKITVLPPPPGVPKDDQNLNSVGLLVQYGTFKALMTGDSETAETAGWLKKYPAGYLGPVQVYKSIHHGAANGDNLNWLKAVQPSNVIISVGPNNYGHPTQTALNQYRSVGSSVYSTDQEGTITVTVQSGGAYSLSTEKGGVKVQSTTTTNAPARPTNPPALVPTHPTVPAQTVTYRNCAEARAAGVTPLLRGQPGYSPNLDRDGDGRACE